MESFSIVNKYFEANGFELTEAKLEYIAKNTVSITNLADAQKVMKFLDALEDCDDVQNVFNSMISTMLSPNSQTK